MINSDTAWVDFWDFPLANQIINHVGKRFVMAKSGQHIWRNSDPSPNWPGHRDVIYWQSPDGESNFSAIEYEVCRRDNTRLIQLQYGGNTPSTSVFRYMSPGHASARQPGCYYPSLAPWQGVAHTEMWRNTNPNDREYIALVREGLDEAGVFGLLGRVPSAQRMFAERFNYGVEATVVYQCYLQQENGFRQCGVETCIYLTGYQSPPPDGPPEAARHYLRNGELLWSIYMPIPPTQFLPGNPNFEDEIRFWGRQVLNNMDFCIYEGIYNVNGSVVADDGG